LNDVMNGLGNTPPTVMIDSAEGSPSPGSLKITAPYSNANQYVDLQKTIGTSTPQNWMGRRLYVRIKVTQGTFPGGVQVYVKTGNAYAFGGAFTMLQRNSNWQEFSVDGDHPPNPVTPTPGYDATKVVAFGLQLTTGSAGTGATPVTF